MNVEDGERRPLFPQRVERLRASGSLTRREADALEERGDRRSEVRVRVRDQDAPQFVHLSWCSSPSPDGGPRCFYRKAPSFSTFRVRANVVSVRHTPQSGLVDLPLARRGCDRETSVQEPNCGCSGETSSDWVLRGEEGCGDTCSRNDATPAFASSPVQVRFRIRRKEIAAQHLYTGPHRRRRGI